MALAIIVLAILAFVVFMNKSDSKAIELQRMVNQSNHITELRMAIDRKQEEMRQVNKVTNYSHWSSLRNEVENLQAELARAVPAGRYY